MVTYYAAMGKYRLEKPVGNVRLPVLMLGGEDYFVSVAEFVVWSSLLWKILNRDTLLAESARGASVFECSLSEEVFEQTLNRLLMRGLVVSGEGGTGAEALQELMMKTRLAPFQVSRIHKIRPFITMLQNGYPFFKALRIFKGKKLSSDEAAVWALLDDDPMTAQEIIFCTKQSSNADAPTSAQQVMAVLANLYLKRMVVLETA